MTSSARRIVLATGNAKKGRELREIVGARFDVATLADVGLAHMEIVEDGDTFAANARIKADAVYDALAAAFALHDVAAVLADDSGLIVDALDGLPGVRSARFAADHGAGQGDVANNALLLARLQDVDDGRRAARFRCAICARLPDGRVVLGDGALEGRIARDLTGASGFGYDPLFIVEDGPPSSRGRRLAELRPDEKHAISHRGRALRTVLSRL